MRRNSLFSSRAYLIHVRRMQDESNHQKRVQTCRGKRNELHFMREYVCSMKCRNNESVLIRCCSARLASSRINYWWLTAVALGAQKRIKKSHERRRKQTKRAEFSHWSNSNPLHTAKCVSHYVRLHNQNIYKSIAIFRLTSCEFFRRISASLSIPSQSHSFVSQFSMGFIGFSPQMRQ